MQGFGISALAAAMLMAGVAGTSALAGADGTEAIKNRRALMTSNGESAKIMGAMLKGEGVLDAAKATAALADLVRAAHSFGADFVTSFPDGTATGDTAASSTYGLQCVDVIDRSAPMPRQP